MTLRQVPSGVIPSETNQISQNIKNLSKKRKFQNLYSWKQISLLEPSAISNISRTTNSDEIIVLPDEFTGNSAGESNVVLEFYLQRHAITVADNSVILCRDLNKKVPGISGIYKFDETLSMYAHEQC